MRIKYVQVPRKRQFFACKFQVRICTLIYFTCSLVKDFFLLKPDHIKCEFAIYFGFFWLHPKEQRHFQAWKKRKCTIFSLTKASYRIFLICMCRIQQWKLIWLLRRVNTAGECLRVSVPRTGTVTWPLYPWSLPSCW